ncbi:hypothetical protein BSL78_28529 [Apostichopus japonicus]|uniref:Uncharacterized protein n=1 Tax=Stichopus japonicus TaxID=307972 RepID=A0A2G8JFW8_STIJA|nr:hypothetical protein BSL78_28529 [Apostichopus japonicus]
MQQQNVMQQVQKVYSSPVDMMKMPGMSHSQGGGDQQQQQRQVNFMGNQIGLAGSRVTQMSSNLQGMGHSFFS